MLVVSGCSLPWTGAEPWDRIGSGDAFAAGAGYNEWAEANKLLVLYPQVASSKIAPMNPNGITSDPDTGKLLLVPWSNGEEVIAWDIDAEKFSSVGKLIDGGNYDGIEVVGDTIIVASQMDTSLHFMLSKSY